LSLSLSLNKHQAIETEFPPDQASITASISLSSIKLSLYSFGLLSAVWACMRALLTCKSALFRLHFHYSTLLLGALVAKVTRIQCFGPGERWRGRWRAIRSGNRHRTRIN